MASQTVTRMRARIAALNVVSRPGVVLLAISAAALGVFTFRIGAASFWLDEAFSVQSAQAGTGSIVAQAQRTAEVNMVLYYLVLRWWAAVSVDEAWIRLLSALWMVGAVVVLWVLARRLFGTRVAMWAAVLMATHGFVIRYAQEARSYALTTFLVLAATLLLVTALERRRVGWWLAYGIVVASIGYAHLVALAILPVHALAIATYPRRPPLAATALAGLVVVLGAAPLLVAIVAHGQAAVVWVGAASVDNGAQIASAFLAGSQEPTLIGVALAVLSTALWVAGATVLWQARRTATGWTAVLVLGWLLLPPVLLAIVSLAKPMLIARYLLFVTPAGCLLAAVALARMSRRPRAALGAAVIGLSLVVASSYFHDPGKPDWRGATEYVASRATARDRWLSYESWNWRPVALYMERLADPTDFPLRLWRDLDSGATDYAGRLEATAAGAAREHRRLVVVTSPTSRGSVDPRTDPVFDGVRRSMRVADARVFDRVVVVVFEPLESAVTRIARRTGRIAAT